MSAYEHCKPGCILKGPEEGWCHRTPIDCVTVDDLWKEIDRLKGEITARDARINQLKIEVYDAREENDE